MNSVVEVSLRLGVRVMIVRTFELERSSSFHACVALLGDLVAEEMDGRWMGQQRLPFL